MKLKLVVLTTLLLAILGFTKSLKSEYYSNENNNERDSINIRNVLNENWQYKSSYNKDTICVFNTLGDLPLKIFYYECKISNSSVKFLRKYKEFNNICSIHDSKPFGNKSYPVIVDKLKTSMGEKIRIQHYATSGLNIGKGYYYYILKASKDSLVLANERYYNVGNKAMLFNHVYTSRHGQTGSYLSE